MAKIVAGDVNQRTTLCTLIAEFSVPENFNKKIAAYNFYNLIQQYKKTYPFLMDMVQDGDLVLTSITKPAPPGQARYSRLTARYSSKVSQSYGLTADTWQKSFLNFLKEIRSSLWCYKDDSIADPLITVYTDSASTFNL